MNDQDKQLEEVKNENIISQDQFKQLGEYINKGNLLGFMEFMTGMVGSSKTDLLISAGRLGQALVKGELYQQLFFEIQEKRKKGEVDEEYLQSTYGKKDFADILELIENENLDPKKWDAIRNIFYNNLTKNSDDKNRARLHYLTRLCLKLEAFDIEVLSACFSMLNTPNHGYEQRREAAVWIKVISEKLGYNLPEFVELSENRLIDLGLLSNRTYADRSGVNIGTNFRLTTLGIALCEVIL